MPTYLPTTPTPPYDSFELDWHRIKSAFNDVTIPWEWNDPLAARIEAVEQQATVTTLLAVVAVVVTALACAHHAITLRRHREQLTAERWRRTVELGLIAETIAMLGARTEQQHTGQLGHPADDMVSDRIEKIHKLVQRSYRRNLGRSRPRGMRSVLVTVRSAAGLVGTFLLVDVLLDGL